MNAHDRLIFARKCKRLGITAEFRRPVNPHWIPAWAPLVSSRLLADLDPNDDRRLPDGSRWVDAEALRRVVLHVAGVPHE